LQATQLPASKYVPLEQVQFKMDQLPAGDHGKVSGHLTGACMELGQKYVDGHSTTAKRGFKIISRLNASGNNPSVLVAAEHCVQ